VFLRSVLALGLAFAGLACGEPAPEPGEPELQVGTGSWRFDALEDGQEVDLVRGAQGGWHVWISFRMRDVPMDRPPIRLTLQPADESREPKVATLELPFEEPSESGWRKRIGYTGIVDDPACIVGELLRIRAELEVEGETLVSERDVRVMGGAYPPPPCE
jgi:hypothetical protein